MREGKTCASVGAVYPSRMRERYITARGIKTRYIESGQGGTPLVLLHGLSGSVEDWNDVLPTLARGRRVIAVDLLGCGQTDKPTGCAYTPDDMRNHVVATLDALDLKRVDLNGWSMGGRIALDLAYHVPARVRRLIVTAPAGIGPDSIVNFHQPVLPLMGAALTQPTRAGWRIMRNAMRKQQGDETLALVGRRMRMALDPRMRRAFAKQLQSLMGPKGFRAGPRRALLAQLPAINVPTLAIWGRDDMFVPLSHAAILQDHLPQCDLVVLDRAGHVPQFERPVAYAQAIRQFVEGAATAPQD